VKYNFGASGTEFTLEYQKRFYQVKTPLIGKFNLYNSLAALGFVIKLGLNIEDCLKWLSLSPQTPGRFELIDEGQDFTLAVDYAHTPDGLLNVISAAREITKNKIITVFGCGGDRDKIKRPLMADIAARLSDFVVLTSDNPRSENPLDILKQIETGIKNSSCPYVIIENRREAISAAIARAAKGDIVIIAGKGHENYQLVNGKTLHFDDRETAGELLRKRLKTGERNKKS
jgi:UDP-N-acetylmuramoyl-L-alanyl-D-glutamate--2,6-diaminopimelate ligase